MQIQKATSIIACALLLASCGSVTDEQWEKQAEREAHVKQIIENATKGELKIDTIGALPADTNATDSTAAQ